MAMVIIFIRVAASSPQVPNGAPGVSWGPILTVIEAITVTVSCHVDVDVEDGGDSIDSH